MVCIISYNLKKKKKALQELIHADIKTAKKPIINSFGGYFLFILKSLQIGALDYDAV